MVVDTLPTQIVRYPDACLRRKCTPIEVFDESVAALAKRMLELMKAGPGVGLAGPQVGVCRRIIVCNPTGQPGDDHVFINPELTDLSGAVEAEEGCLSLPDVHVIRRRAKRSRIRALDVTGRPIEAEAEDLMARIWQHETDHLEGRLIIDAMSAADQVGNGKALARLEGEYRKSSKKRVARTA